jgi:hypothetical protein
VSYVLNNFHILVYQVEYRIILLLETHLYEWEIWLFFRVSKKTEFTKALMNLEDVHGQNKHNSENQMKSLGRQLCEYYYIGLHKRLIV